jgi:hypothetical protein
MFQIYQFKQVDGMRSHCMNEAGKSLVVGLLSTVWELTKSQRSHCALPRVFVNVFLELVICLVALVAP